MPDRETIVSLDDEFRGLLLAEAEQRGITPERLAAQLIREQLRKRTAPKTPRGTVRPFRRKPE